MVLYLSTIIIAMITVALINILVGTPIFAYSPWFVIMAVVVSTIIVILLDGLIALIFHNFPDRWFTHDKKIFKVNRNESKFYEKLKIKKWKDKVWEIGGLGGFRKNKLKDASDPEYINKFLIESNKGMSEHLLSLPLGFLIIFIFPLKYALWIGVPVAIVNFVLNLLPILVLRYNIPKLEVVLKRAERIKAMNTGKDLDQENEIESVA